MDNKQIVHRKCQEANPSLLQLSFGYRIKHKDISGICILFRKWGNENLEFIYSDGGDGFYRISWAQKLITENPHKEFEILGHEPTLGDVIKALSMHTPNNMNGRTILIGEYGAFYEEMRDYNKRLDATWNLSLPFSEQSDETFEFLANLLK